MMNNLTNGTSATNQYWGRGEKWVGALFPIFLIGLVLVGAYYLLPPLVVIMKNLLWVILLAIPVIGIPLGIFLFWDWFVIRYQMFIKKLWEGLVKNDPITIMKIMYDKWTRERTKVSRNLEVLSAAENELLMKMKENENDANVQFAQAKKAKEMADSGKGDKDKLTRSSYKSGVIAQRRVESNKNFVPRLKAIQAARDYMQKLYDHWGDDLELLKDDINQKESDLKVLASTSSALDAAQSIINGNPNERALMEMSNKAYAEKLSMYVGKIKNFTQQAEQWVYSKEIQDAVFDENTDKLLSMYDTETFAQLTDFSALMKEEAIPVKGFADSSARLNENLQSFNDLK